VSDLPIDEGNTTAGLSPEDNLKNDSQQLLDGNSPDDTGVSGEEAASSSDEIQQWSNEDDEQAKVILGSNNPEVDSSNTELEPSTDGKDPLTGESETADTSDDAITNGGNTDDSPTEVDSESVSSTNADSQPTENVENSSSSQVDTSSNDGKTSNDTSSDRSSGENDSQSDGEDTTEPSVTNSQSQQQPETANNDGQTEASQSNNSSNEENATDNQFEFTSGTFEVGSGGQVSVDYLFDGGSYEGEVGIFSLQGMEEFWQQGEQAFIEEAAKRATSHSTQGHVVIRDRSEGARFSGELGESDRNQGDYPGIQTFEMESGDKFAVMLVPKGSIEEVAENPSMNGNQRPLFSLATANPDDRFHLTQIADVTGDGNTFAMEDLPENHNWFDSDYNDFIFQIQGAVGEAESLDKLIDQEEDWRELDSASELMSYARENTTNSSESELVAEDKNPSDGSNEQSQENSDRGASETEVTEASDSDSSQGTENNDQPTNDNQNSPNSDRGASETELTEASDSNSSQGTENNEQPTSDNQNSPNSDRGASKNEVTESSDSNSSQGTENNEQPTNDNQNSPNSDRGSSETELTETSDSESDVSPQTKQNSDRGASENEVTESSDSTSSQGTENNDQPTNDNQNSPNSDRQTEKSVETSQESNSQQSENNENSNAQNSQPFSLESGVFEVGEQGQVTFDYLFDAGSYESELGIFNLEGMENFQQQGEEAFLREAVRRAASNSSEGHVVIEDRQEGARFTGTLGEKDRSEGDYQGIKTFEMESGEQFGVVLVPDGTLNEALDSSSWNDKQRPIVSLPSLNEDGQSQIGQIADITGKGNTFAIEDIPVENSKFDGDYNDLIFQIQGATGETALYEDLVQPDADWTDTQRGESLVHYVNREGSDGSIQDRLSDRVKFAIERSQDLESHQPEALAQAEKWVVGLDSNYSSAQLARLFEAEDWGATGHIPNTYVWHFPEQLSPEQIQNRLADLQGIDFAYPLVATELESLSPQDDPLYKNQWHLEETNVSQVWDRGVTGKETTIGMVDNGIQHDHPDLQENYRADLSRDFNETQDGTYDNNPAPETDNTDSTTQTAHGTAMAGIAAASGGNGIGGSGAAPDASLAGLRLTGEDSVTGWQIADALSYLNNDIDIYNNSWKPNNSFWSSPLAEYRLETGANQGRDGAGNVYVFGAGNDGLAMGGVNYNAFANSRHTIAVGAVDNTGSRANYSEMGTPVLLSAPSDRLLNSQFDDIEKALNSAITTTDLMGSEGRNPGGTETDYQDGDYTMQSGGTSSAAALVSGIGSLILDANPDLTWRDVQHILIETAQQPEASNPEQTDSGWITNGGGYQFHPGYGFGVIDAEAAVEAAQDWTPVGTEVKLSSGGRHPNQTISNNGQQLNDSIQMEEDITVESAEVMFDASHPVKGDLEVSLVHTYTDPETGETIETESLLATPNSSTAEDYNKWIFTSASHWGETSQGEWELRVADEVSQNSFKEDGTWNSWQLNLYGSKPTVTIEATDADANEGGDPGEFTFSRTGNTHNPLTVNYTIEGEHHWSRPQASNGTDYKTIDEKSITIPQGESSVTLPIQPLEDGEPEWPETVRLKLEEKDGYEIGADNMDVVTIWDNEPPQLHFLGDWWTGQPHIYHTDAYTSEAGNAEHFLIRRTGSLEEDITFYYSFPGEAENGKDFQELSGQMTLPAHKQENYLSFYPIDDDEVEGEETLKFKAEPHPSYTLGENPTIPITIWDNDDKNTVSLEATDNKASEYGDPGEFTITRSGDLSEPLEVDLWFNDSWRHFTENDGTDYQKVDNPITIPAGEDTYKIQIDPIDDNEIEITEYIEPFIREKPNYAVDHFNDSVYVYDNEIPSQKGKTQLGSSEREYNNGIAADDAGNSYVAGRTSGDLAGNNAGSWDAFVAKYDANQNLQWQQQLGSSGFDEATDVDVDAAGNIYATGWTDGNLAADSSGRHAWIAKYDNGGNLQWKRELDTSIYDKSGSLYELSSNSIAVDASGQAYISGYTYGNLAAENPGSSADAWLAKYDTNGNQTWVRQLGSKAWDEANDITLDGNGSVYLTGQTEGQLASLANEKKQLADSQADDTDAWISKYDINGNQQWTKQLGTVAWDESQSISANAHSDIYLSGSTKGWMGETFDGDNDDWMADYDAWWGAIHGDRSDLGGTYFGKGDAWVAQFQADGNLNWRRILGTPESDRATGVAADELGNVYLTGHTRGQVADTPAGKEDVFIARYNHDGALQWWEQAGTANTEKAQDLAMSSAGLFLAGDTLSNFGGTHQGKNDAWTMYFR